MNHITRRLLLSVFPSLLIAAGLVSCSFLYRQLGGPYATLTPEIFPEGAISCDARDLINKAFDGLPEDTPMADYHVHFFGMGDPNPYVYNASLQKLPESDRPTVNEDTLKKGRPIVERPFVVGTLLATADARRATIDDDWAKRLVRLVAGYGAPKYGRNPASSPHATHFHLMAMDGKYDANGKLQDTSVAVVTNVFAVELTKELNLKLDESGGFTKNRFVAVGSVNPMRQNWRCQLRYLCENEVKWIKWRPATMEFDPGLVEDAFYEELKKRGIGILSHTGTSTGIKVSPELNAYAAPIRLTKALNHGVTVVMLHMGREGIKGNNEVYFKEFVSMLNEQRYKKNLFGEMSAIPYKTEHLLPALVDLCEDRVLNGSDYPAFPYFLARTSLRRLVKECFLCESDRRALDEIFRYNPLLFDFVLKRTLNVRGKPIPSRFFRAIEVAKD